MIASCRKRQETCKSSGRRVGGGCKTVEKKPLPNTATLTVLLREEKGFIIFIFFNSLPFSGWLQTEFNHYYSFFDAKFLFRLIATNVLEYSLLNFICLAYALVCLCNFQFSSVYLVYLSAKRILRGTYMSVEFKIQEMSRKYYIL